MLLPQDHHFEPRPQILEPFSDIFGMNSLLSSEYIGISIWAKNTSPLLKDLDRYVKIVTGMALRKLREEALPSIRYFLQKEKDKQAIESALQILGEYLQAAYIKENTSSFTQVDVMLLSKSKEKGHLDTVAAIYVWQKNAEKAHMLPLKQKRIPQKE
ncbi:hypothetical protein UABAM_04547 [Candidatus Uabimicrobium amorphum]|uniref:Uncharacterized protein n=1 Tax=Uabimicrobium amorphum TaxID=2596890 RepID=A0A5S9F5C7_UABAM|nr:hypothetical protein [Candidatus Uabimicrobium amorphum]BBM86161.1 hypothetical protein UABAM_04547 [Candidatus Uabimicrobium amorphum]